MKKLRTNVRITELDTISDVLLRLYKADTALAKDEYLKAVMAEVEDLSSKITTAIKSDKIVSKLEEADLKRDGIIHSLGTLLNGYAVIPVESKKSVAATLLDTFNKYKGITTESYANESSLIESMLEDFAKPELADSISELEGVSAYITGLRTAQDEFNKANDEFTAANTGKGSSATALKKPLFAVINNKLVAYLTAMCLANNALYGDFTAKAEAEIVKANSAVSKRATPQEE